MNPVDDNLQDEFDFEAGAPYPPKPSADSASTTYRDAFFAVIFALHLAVILALAIFKGIPAVAQGGIDQVDVDPAGGSETPVNDGDNPIPLVLSLGVVMVLGAFLSTVWVKVLVSHGESVVRCTILSTVAWFVLSAVAAALLGQSGGAVALLVLAGIAYWYYVLINSHIEFAGKNLKVACSAVLAMPGTVTVAVTLLTVQALWCMIWGLAMALWCMVWGLAMLGVATNFSAPITAADGTVYDADDCTTYETQRPNPTFSAACTGYYGGGTCFKCVCGGATVYDDAECRSERVSAGVYALMLLSERVSAGVYALMLLSEHVSAGVYALMLLSLIWGCGVIANISHCTTAGAVAAWWFAGRNGPAADASSPVTASLRRACTTSLGTVCLAALAAAVARLLAAAATRLRRSRRGMGALWAAAAECLAHAAERVVRVFSRYALVHAAVYGTTLPVAGSEVEVESNLVERVVREFSRYALVHAAVYGTTLPVAGSERVVRVFSRYVLVHAAVYGTTLPVAGSEVEVESNLVERVVREFSRYALVHAAVYGTPLPVAGSEMCELVLAGAACLTAAHGRRAHRQSSPKVWALFKRRGWSAIVNDQLCDNALALACAVVAALCGLAGAAAGALCGMSGLLTALLASFGVLMGYNLAAVAVSVVILMSRTFDHLNE
ncbi:plasma-membrane choline transporter-domain-containing protein [Tribonema minus]|uniref:Choline transporter-like protein n=1 Tax=Tribonema minus TaxID=303371 RepID=A0A835YM59_9STRA|nr:plasma-membrane choline transporter-domain-containing protein [Tribonema minus]